MLRKSKLFSKLPAGKKLLCDGGFRGEPQFVETPFRRDHRLTAAQRAHNRRVSSQRWRVEAVFSRLKSWHILSDRYRHRLEDHHLVWKVLVTIYNLDVALHPLQR